MYAVTLDLEQTLGVLFICDDNSRRSLIAEALLRDLTVPGVRAFSAGVEPADHADPFTLSALTLAGIDSRGLWPKSWQGFAETTPDLIQMVVFFGNDVAAHVGRAIPGRPEYAVWPDGDNGKKPATHQGAWHTMQTLRRRVDALSEEIHDMRELQAANALPAE